MFAKLTAFTRHYATHKHAAWWLFFYAVIESVFFPIPPDVLLVPLAFANPKKAVFFSTVAAIGSVVGGVAGYAIGYYAFEPVALPVLNWLCPSSPVACPDHFIPALRAIIDKHGLWAVAFSAISPIIPYRFTILVAGLGQMALVPFIIVSLLAHWLRYTLITWSVARYGRKAIAFMRERMTLLLVGGGIIALAVYLLVQYF